MNIPKPKNRLAQGLLALCLLAVLTPVQANTVNGAAQDCVNDLAGYINTSNRGVAPPCDQVGPCATESLSLSDGSQSQQAGAPATLGVPCSVSVPPLPCNTPASCKSYVCSRYDCAPVELPCETVGECKTYPCTKINCDLPCDIDTLQGCEDYLCSKAPCDPPCGFDVTACINHVCSFLQPPCHYDGPVCDSAATCETYVCGMANDCNPCERSNVVCDFIERCGNLQNDCTPCDMVASLCLQQPDCPPPPPMSGIETVEEWLLDCVANVDIQLGPTANAQSSMAGQCTGELSKAKGKASVTYKPKVSAGVLSVGYEATVTVEGDYGLFWTYACTFDWTAKAVGWDGILRRVRVTVDGATSVPVSYSGIAPDNHQESQLVTEMGYGDNGFAAVGAEYPSSVEACFLPAHPIVAYNEPEQQLGLVVTDDDQSAACAVVGIQYSFAPGMDALCQGDPGKPSYQVCALTQAL